MISISSLLTGLNTLLLVAFAVLFFKKNYVILSTEDYNTIAGAVEEYSKQIEANQELAGGTGVEVGFGADYLEDEEKE